jgi:UDP-2,4-diacetamido-2,4,6-trideoxy-beta-L-altropyranose hydrolase
MRCLALARELRERGGVVTFVSRAFAGTLRETLAAEGFETRWLATPTATHRPAADDPSHAAWLGVPWLVDAEDTLAALRAAEDGGGWAWIVADHYGIDARWEAHVAKATKSRILVIDDLADRAHSCDVLLDQNVRADEGDRYAALVPEPCRRFLGPRFALLRPEFRSYSRRKRTANGRYRINIFLGGADSEGLTLRALKAIRSIGPELLVDVVVGRTNPHASWIAGVRDEPERVTLHAGADNMAELFASADLAIGAGGVASLERCCVGVPSVTLSIAENQRRGCIALARERAAVYLGDPSPSTESRLRSMVVRLLARPALLERMAGRARRLVDGRGAQRIALYMARDALDVRPAGLEDAEQAWRWRNHPATRRYIFDPAPIPWGTHEAWWKRSVASDQRSLLVIRSGRTDLGVMRFDYQGDQATVSIYLDPDLLGLGLGTFALRAGRRWLLAQEGRSGIRTLLAEILPPNTSSQRIFASAGYSRTANPIQWTRALRDR